MQVIHAPRNFGTRCVSRSRGKAAVRERGKVRRSKPRCNHAHHRGSIAGRVYCHTWTAFFVVKLRKMSMCLSVESVDLRGCRLRRGVPVVCQVLPRQGSVESPRKRCSSSYSSHAAVRIVRVNGSREGKGRTKASEPERLRKRSVKSCFKIQRLA